MAEKKPIRRTRTVLVPEKKWEVFIETITRENTQSDIARRWGVDVSTVIKIARDGKNAALAAFAKPPGRRGKTPEEVEIEDLRGENARLTETIKEQAVELALTKGKSRWT